MPASCAATRNEVWEAAIKCAEMNFRRYRESEGQKAFEVAIRAEPNRSLPAGYPAQRRNGIAVITLQRGYPAAAFTDAPWLLGGVKTLSYAVNMAAQREASRRGADDVIFTSSEGLVLEAPTSSVVWFAGGTLHTTPRGPSGILGGTTQALLFERAAAAGWQVATTPARAAGRHTADSLGLTCSVRGPVDVVALEGVERRRDVARTAELRGLCGF